MSSDLSANNNQSRLPEMGNRLPARIDCRYLYRAFVRLNNSFFNFIANKVNSVFSSFCASISNAYHRLQGSLCGRAQSIPTEKAQRRLEIPESGLDHAIIHVVDPIEKNEEPVAIIEEEGAEVEEEQTIDSAKMASLKKPIDEVVKKNINILDQIAKVAKTPNNVFVNDIYDFASDVIALRNDCLKFLYREQSTQELFKNLQEIRNELDELIHNCPEDLTFHLEQLLSQCQMSVEALNKLIDALEQ